MNGIILIIAIFIFLTITLVIGGIINSKEPYACPNCGHVFTKRWYNLMLKSGPMVRSGNGELRLKCPSCKKVDFCLHTKRTNNNSDSK